MPRYFTVFQTEGDRYSIACQKQITASLSSETVIYTKKVDEKNTTRLHKHSGRHAALMIYVWETKNNLTEG